MSGFVLQIETADDLAYLKSRIFFLDESDYRLIKIRNAINGILAGTFQAGTATIAVGETAAATLDLSGGDFANNETFVLLGVTFTAKTSGATGNEFNIGATKADTAENIRVAVLNSSSNLIKQCILPSAVGDVVTFTSRIPGVVGNASGGLFTLTSSALGPVETNFAGGTTDTVSNFTI